MINSTNNDMENIFPTHHCHFKATSLMTTPHHLN